MTIAPIPSVSDRDRHEDGRQRRPDDRVEHADHDPGQQRLPRLVDREPAKHPGQEPQHERRPQRGDGGAPHRSGEPWPLRARRCGIRSGSVVVGCGLRRAGRHEQAPAGFEQVQLVVEARRLEVGGEHLGRPGQPRGSAAPVGQRAVGAPVHRHDQARLQQAGRVDGGVGVEVPGPDGLAPAADRHERHVGLGQIDHGVEQVGVAGEVDRAVVAGDHEPDRRRTEAAVGAAPVRVHGGNGLHRDGAEGVGVADPGLDHLGEPGAAYERRRARRHDRRDRARAILREQAHRRRRGGDPCGCAR